MRQIKPGFVINWLNGPTSSRYVSIGPDDLHRSYNEHTYAVVTKVMDATHAAMRLANFAYCGLELGVSESGDVVDTASSSTRLAARLSEAAAPTAKVAQV